MNQVDFTKEQEFVPGRVDVTGPEGASGVDIEIVEKGRLADGPVRVVVPNMVRINGAEILIPDGSTIQISDISNQDVTTVTVTMFVRSLSIRAE